MLAKLRKVEKYCEVRKKIKLACESEKMLVGANSVDRPILYRSSRDFLLEE